MGNWSDHLHIGRKVRAAAPELVTVREVEIMGTGIEYSLASGPTTFTPEDLADAVAAQEDPAVSQPRLKLGHVDPRFDGEPALGKVCNMRLSEDGQTIVGDLVGVPRWLADIMSSAYPSRSIEGNFAVTTVTGHDWRLVINALALLGVTWPGVSVLEDIAALYSPEGPEGVVVESYESKEGSPVGAAVAAASGVEAAANVEDVRRSYYDSLESSQIWWWIRAIYLDPNELIVDDDEGQLYRVPFEIKGDAVEFGEPQEVKIQYVNAKTSGRNSASSERRALALVACAGRQEAVYASRSESRPDNPNQEVTGMNIDIPALRSRLGLTVEQLPDDASEEQVNVAITAGDGGNGTPTGEPGADPNTPTEPAGAPAEGEPSGDPANPPQPSEPSGDRTEAGTPRMVSVPADDWARVQAGAAAGSQVAEQAAREQRERIVSDAIQAGKIRPADKASYLNGLNNQATEAQFKTLLTASVADGGLAPGLVPLTERGSNPADLDVAAAASAYPAEWLPEVQARQSDDNRVTQEA